MEKVPAAPPPFVRRRREAPRVEIPFVVAQVREEPQLFREGVDAREGEFSFFFHVAKLPDDAPRGKQSSRSRSAGVPACRIACVPLAPACGCGRRTACLRCDR